MKSHKITMISLVVVTAVLASLFLPIEKVLVHIHQIATDYPSTALWLTGITFVIGTLLLLPVSPVVMLAGFVFGLGKGLLIIWISACFSSAIAFWVGRVAARDWVERKISNKSILMAIDRAIDRKGMLVVFLSRVVGILPFAPISYSLGLSSVKFNHYFIGTVTGMLPPTFFVVFIGTNVRGLADVVYGNIQLTDRELVVGVFLFVLVVIATCLIIWSARNSLRKELDKAKFDSSANLERKS